MKIRHLQAENFRNFENLDLTFSQDFIILIGPNASGKTNILESVYYTSMLQAFPPGKSWELIMKGKDYFRLIFDTSKGKLEYYYGRKSEKRYQRAQTVEGVRKRSLEMAGVLPCVAFLPQDLNLLQQGPALRRDYLDDVLIQTEPDYERTLAELAKVIMQRNELLTTVREGKGGESELDFWDEKIVKLSKKIVQSRQDYIAFLNQGIQEFYQEISGELKDFRINYLISNRITDPEDLASLLLQRRREDILFGRTSVGPHRDDWKVVGKDGQNLAHFLSRGEQRSLIICLKLKELEYLQQALQERPVVLLDEVLAELDSTRRRRLLERLPTGSQTFLTMTNAETTPKSLLKQAQVIELPLKQP